MVQAANSEAIRRSQSSAVKVLCTITVARRVGYIGAGGLGVREHSSQRRPYAGFFEYFLVRPQESIIAPFTIFTRYQNSWHLTPSLSP